MLPKKQKFTKKTYIGYFIGYNSFDIYKVWNTNKNKINKTKNSIFDKSLCYNPTNIYLNQFINKLFIKIDLFKLIQLNFTDIIKINLTKLKLNSYQSKHLSKLKLHNNIKSLN